MPLATPDVRVWWNEPIAWHERVWLVIVVAVGLLLFIMMPLWHLVGAQNSPTETYRVATEAYWNKVTAFQAADGTLSERTASGAVRPKGEDIYLGALRFAWVPNQLALETGRRYRFHLSSRDVNHGFSIHQDGSPSKTVNFQVVPGYEFVATMTFDQPGTYVIVCQEYCGIGHQAMTARFVVEGSK